MAKFSTMSLAELTRPEGYDCACGKRHAVDLPWLRIERGALAALPEALEAVGAKHPFVVCDDNTYRAAGARVEEVLSKAGLTSNSTSSLAGTTALPLRSGNLAR